MGITIGKVVKGLTFAAQKVGAIFVGKIVTEQCMVHDVSFDKAVLIGGAATIATDAAIGFAVEKIEEKIYDDYLDEDDLDDFDDEDYDMVYEQFLRDHDMTEDDIVTSFENIMASNQEEDLEDTIPDEDEEEIEEIEVVKEAAEEVAETAKEIVEDVGNAVEHTIEQASEVAEAVAETVTKPQRPKSSTNKNRKKKPGSSTTAKPVEKSAE